MLPEGDWRPLDQWLRVELPLAGLPAGPPGPVAWRLCRDERPRESNLLLATAEAWGIYAATAAQVRLDRWTFAADEQGRVLIRGLPLPPIAGQFYCEEEGIAVPAGWRWDPPLAAAVLRAAIGLAGRDLALLGPDGTCSIVREADWVRATRSAARLTAAGRSDG
jgi:hypothetical protein